MADFIFADKSKLAIASALAGGEGELSFSELLEETQLTNGNLSSHLKKLEELKIVKMKKQFVNNRPLTTVRLTTEGRAELKKYVTHLRGILEKVEKFT